MRFYIFIIATLFLVAVSVPTAIAQTYHITDLGTLGAGNNSAAFGINNSGEVVGRKNFDGGTYQAFSYASGAVVDLGTLGGSLGIASGVNASGQIVGTSFLAGDNESHAFVYSGGTMHDIGTFGGSYSSALGINNSGQVVGSAAKAGNSITRAFLYTGGTMQDLGTLPGYTDSGAEAINASGQIAGGAAGGGNTAVAVLFSGSTIINIGANQPTWYASDAHAINSSGQVVGDYLYDYSYDKHRAFLFSAGNVTDLGSFGAGLSSVAYGINSSGQIVGQADSPTSGTPVGFLYSAGVMKDLNSLLDGLSSDRLISANAINDNGWIVGWGTSPDGDFRALLLTPVPEPSAFLLSTLCCCGCCWLARRKKRQELSARRKQHRGVMPCRLCPFATLLAAVLMTGSISSAVQAQSFTGLGFVSGFTSESDANAISGDGSTVVGLCLNSSNNPDAFRWTKTTGMVALPTFSTALGTSANGSVIVGSAFGSKGASRWTQPTGWVSLGHLTGGTISSTTAQGVSGDGNVVVGTGGSTLGNQAFRWTQATGMTGLGDLPGGTFLSNANGISDDSATIVGYSDSGTGGEAFRWTQATGMVGLGFLLTNLSYSFSAAYAASVDGSVIVGQGTAMDGQDPFRWTQATGMVDLGGGAGLALATSADGSIVVGEGESGAFIWDLVHGMRNLQNVLTNDYGLGNSLAGWHLRRGTGLSADGNSIVGWGINPNGNYEGWIVNVPEPSAFLMAALGVVGLFGLRYLIIGSHQLVSMRDMTGIESITRATAE